MEHLQYTPAELRQLADYLSRSGCRKSAEEVHQFRLALLQLNEHAVAIGELLALASVTKLDRPTPNLDNTELQQACKQARINRYGYRGNERGPGCVWARHSDPHHFYCKDVGGVFKHGQSCKSYEKPEYIEMMMAQEHPGVPHPEGKPVCPPTAAPPCKACWEWYRLNDPAL
jgi:hypothetical protein